MTDERPDENADKTPGEDPGERSGPEIVRDKWNETLKSKAAGPQRQLSWHSETVHQFLNRNYLKGRSVGGYLRAHLGNRPIRRALEIGGGLGRQAENYYRWFGVEKFDVMDISTSAVEAGNRRAAEEGLNIEFAVRDLNKDALPADTYDLVIANGALHHIANLEHLFEQISRALTPAGVFFANDYMGPNYMQWTEAQLGLMNAILGTFPDEKSRVRHRDNQVVKEITRIPLEIFEKHHPIEGVRASEILDVAAEYLEIIETVPICQTILYELLRGRVHNFDDFDPMDRAFLELLCLFEKTLFDSGLIDSDFNLIIARRRS